MAIVRARTVRVSVCLAALAGCTSTAVVGERYDADVPPADVADATEPSDHIAAIDGPDVPPAIDVPDVPTAVDATDATVPRDAIDGGDACAGIEVCDGVDNDCDGEIDEGFCRIDGACFTHMQRNPGNACQACALTSSTRSGPTAWSNVAAGVECRASAGPCDPPETCAGDGVACPADVLAPGGTASYTRGASPLTFIDACAAPGSRRAIVSADQAFTAEGLPFSFRFFGVPQTVVVVAVNGMVSFSSAAATAADANATLPHAAIPDTVFAFWDDLQTRSPGVCIATVGAAPDRRFVVEWRDAGFAGTAPASHLDFEVVLTESSHTLDVIYRRLDDATDRASGSSATIGLQGGDASTFDLVAFDAAGSVRPGMALRWTPRPTVVCRPSAGPCDPDEVCTGTSAACPADTFVPVTLCRPSAGPCDAVERCTGSSAACPADAFGPGSSACAAGLVCAGAACCPAGRTPVAETCNDVDDDCDGVIDDGVTRDCYSGAAGTAGVGTCRLGVQSCVAGVWGGCGGEVPPVAEVCNGRDDNCNGAVDEGIMCP